MGARSGKNRRSAGSGQSGMRGMMLSNVAGTVKEAVSGNRSGRTPRVFGLQLLFLQPARVPW